MLRINVGMSRKVTEDYNSRGFSLNIEGELPSEVLGDQKALAESTNRLFALASLMLDEQVHKATSAKAAPDIQAERTGRNDNGQPLSGNGHTYNRSNGNGNNGNGHHNGERLLTQAQSRAITNMARKLNQDADQWVRYEFGADKIADLTVKQASEAIDLLKQGIEAATKGGGQ